MREFENFYIVSKDDSNVEEMLDRWDTGNVYNADKTDEYDGFKDLDTYAILDSDKLPYTYITLHPGKNIDDALDEFKKNKSHVRLLDSWFDNLPMDKEFNGELCHATGYEWYDGKEWWNEYEDSDGNLHYGR